MLICEINWESLLRVSARCAATAVILEFLTVFGTPGASVFNPSDWSVKRVGVLFALVLVVRAAFLYVKSNGAFDGIIAYWSDRTGQKIKHLLAASAVSAALVTAVYVLSLFAFSLSWRVCLALALTALAVFLMISLRELIVREFEYVYLIFGLLVSILMCLFIPPTTFASADDQIHYDNSLAMSYIIYPKYTAADEDLVVVGNLWDEDGGRYFHEHGLILSDETWDGLADILDEGDDEVDISMGEPTQTLSAGSYFTFSMVGHIPNALGLWLGRALHVGLAGGVLLGRLSSAAFFVLMMFLAMRQLESGKLILAAIALFPQIVFLSANYSYDPWLVALIAYSFCVFAGTLQREDGVFRSYDLGRMLVSFFLGALVKAVYFPLVFILLFVPREKYADARNRRRFMIAVVLSAIALIGSFALPLLLSRAEGAGDVRGGSDVNAAGQIIYILTHPLEALTTFFSFSAGFFSPWNLAAGSLVFFAYLGVASPELRFSIGIEYLLFHVILLCVDRTASDRTFAGCHLAIPTAVCSFLSYAGCAAAMYITFTAVGSDTVAGMQGRYLLPLAVPFCLFTCYSRMDNSSISKARLLALFVVVESLLWLQTYITFFIPCF